MLLYDELSCGLLGAISAIAASTEMSGNKKNSKVTQKE
jgi:hypothetical protein